MRTIRRVFAATLTKSVVFVGQIKAYPIPGLTSPWSQIGRLINNLTSSDLDVGKYPDIASVIENVQYDGSM